MNHEKILFHLIITLNYTIITHLLYFFTHILNKYENDLNIEWFEEIEYMVGKYQTLFILKQIRLQLDMLFYNVATNNFI